MYGLLVSKQTLCYLPRLAPGPRVVGSWVYYRVNPGVMTRMSAVLAPPPAVTGPAG